MGYGSGLSGQIGFATEGGGYGVPATVSRFFECDDEAFQLEPVDLDSNGWHAGIGGVFRRGSRHVRSGRSGTGGATMELPTNGLGLLLKHMLGSSATAVQQGGTAAYKQVHVPGPRTGLSFTSQKGVPQTDGTVKPFTAAGCKITDWTIGCNVGEIATLALQIFSKDVVTSVALAPAVYPTSNVFHFLQGSILLGGTPSTASGETTVAGGTPVAGINAISVHQAVAATGAERTYFGSGGAPAEPIENDWSDWDGTLAGDFVNQAAIYDLYDSNTPSVLELKFVGPLIAGAYYQTLDIVIPQIYFTGETPKLSGVGVVPFSAPWVAKQNPAGDNPGQITLISTDTTV